MGDDLEPRGLFGGDLSFLHPPLAFLVSAGRDIGCVRIALDAEGIVEIAAAQMLECHLDLATRRWVEHIGRRIKIKIGVAARAWGLDQIGDGPRQAQQFFFAQAEPGRFVAEEFAIGRASPPLAARSRTLPLQFVEELLALGGANHRQLGVIGRARSRVAQQCPAQGGDLIEEELVGVPGLGIARAHRPERLLFLKRSLDLGPVGPWINP